MRSYGSPEEAARGDVAETYVHVVGVVIRGDTAIVAQLMNDGPPFEVETAYVFRDPSGGWSGGTSSNGTAGFLPTGEGVGTFFAWGEAPEGVVAARFICRDREAVVPVAQGFAFAVFDVIGISEPVSAAFDAPRIAAWISADGTEQLFPEHEPSRWMREGLRRRVE